MIPNFAKQKSGSQIGETGQTLGIESTRADGTVITALVPVPRLRGTGATLRTKHPETFPADGDSVRPL